MNKKVISLSLLIILLFSSMLINTQICLSLIDSPKTIIERGSDYIIKGLGDNKYSWESQPKWVYNGLDWVPYIYSHDDVKKCHNVQVGFVGAKIYNSGVVEIYDPDLNEIRVKGETWELWSNDKKAILNKPINWSVITNSSGVFIISQQVTSKPDGILVINYIFLIGASLKHTVIWTSMSKTDVVVQVKQIHLMSFDKVTTDGGISLISKSDKSTTYLFGYGAKGFWVFEDQYAMVYGPDGALLVSKCLQTGDIDFAGKKVTYTFGDWALTQGQSLVVDPDTATLSNPTVDGYIDLSGGTYVRNTVDSYVSIYADNSPRIRHGYFEWPVTSIPDPATITNTVFKYNGYIYLGDCHIHAMALQPSAQPNNDTGNHAVYDDAGNGTVYADPAGFPVEGTNKEVDLGTTADSDLQSALAGNWFAIGGMQDNEAADYLHSRIYSEEQSGVTPPPTLYVEYTVIYPTNDSLILDLTGSEYKEIKTLLTMKQDYKFVYKCSDLNEVTDITYAEIRLDYTDKNVILRVTRDVGDTWIFSEQSDPSDYVTLNVAGSTHSTSGTQKTFNFLVKINWGWGDSLDTLGIQAYIITSTLSSDTDEYVNMFGVEAHIKAYSLAVNDYRCNPFQVLIFSGYWYYNGTNIYPPNNDYQVKIKLSGVQKGSINTTLINGYFEISDISAENAINSYSYTVEATYMDSTGSYSPVIVDSLNVVLSASNYIATINNYAKISWVITREYDNSTSIDFIIDISKDNVLWLDDETLGYGYDINIIKKVIRYNCTSVTDNVYDLNIFTTNYIDISWVSSVTSSFSAGLFIGLFITFTIGILILSTIGRRK